MRRIDRIPMEDRPLLSDGGLETTLLFQDGIDLPGFAAFPLVETEAGREHLRAYFRRYLPIALAAGAGFVLESPTWRASARWGREIGYTLGDLDRINRDAILFLEELRREFEAAGVQPTLVSGCIGPHGDGYAKAFALTVDQAERYHAPQIETFAATPADMVSAFTLTHAEEAIGIARAAGAAAIPSVISFTVETDGRLPSGEDLGDAIRRVDDACRVPPAWYMVNCAHPSHFAPAFERGRDWQARVGGLRANASCLSHAELDGSETLDEGDPADLGRRYAALRTRLPHVRVFGGCCGTDHRHVEAIARACWPARVAV